MVVLLIHNLTEVLCPCTGLDMPLVLQEAEATRISRQSAHEDGKFVSPSASILEYGASCWGPYREGHINKLDRVQKKEAKFSCHTNDSVWETLAQHRKTARICAIFKAYTGESVWKSIGDRLKGP
jgi:hypothetical protein